MGSKGLLISWWRSTLRQLLQGVTGVPVFTRRCSGKLLSSHRYATSVDRLLNSRFLG